MAILLVQTFLLLLGAFLLGASLACLVRRTFSRRTEAALPAAAPALAAAQAVPPAVFYSGDADRFGRALMGGGEAASAGSPLPAAGPVIEVQPRPPARDVSFTATADLVPERDVVEPFSQPEAVAPEPEAVAPPQEELLSAPEIVSQTETVQEAAPPPTEPLPAEEPLKEDPALSHAPAPEPQPEPEPQWTDQSYTQIAVAAAAGAAAMAARKPATASEERDEHETDVVASPEEPQHAAALSPSSSETDGRSYTEVALGVGAGRAAAGAESTQPEPEPESTFDAAAEPADAEEALLDDGVSDEDVSGDEFSGDGASGDDISGDDISSDDVSRDDVSDDDVVCEDVSDEDVPDGAHRSEIGEGAEATGGVELADGSEVRESAAAASRFGTPVADAAAVVGHDRGADEGDDLTRIHGIDADLRGRLNRLGITRFLEIGGWSVRDLARYSQSLGVLPARIEQENWIEQAQVLASGGVTDYPAWRGPELMPRAPLPADGERLHRIIGIDPDSEGVLRANGVTSLADIAAWSEDDVSWYERILGIPGRIGRENWVEQARFLTRGAGDGDGIESVAPRASETTADDALAEISEASLGEPREPEALVHETPEAPEAEGDAAPRSGVADAGAPDTDVTDDPSTPDATKDTDAADAGMEVHAGDEDESLPPATGGSRSDAIAGLRSVRSEALRGSGGYGVPPVGQAEDLKRIRGIGVLIEKKLHSLGIISYEQVANWTGEDIERISQLLDFRGRIERENWIEQARILASGGQTEFSRRVDRGEA